MRIRTRALVVSALFASTLVGGATADAADGDSVDVSCVWRKLVRRNTSRGPTLTPRMRGTVDVAFEGSPAPRRISVALYASTDGVSLAGARLATKFVRPRAGRTVRVTFDTTVPFGDPGRFLVARADDADEVIETDEANNVAAYGPFVDGEEYFPLETGTRWRYAGIKTEGGAAPVAYVTSDVVTGDHVVDGGVVVRAILSSNDGNSGKPKTNYARLDDHGVFNWGSDDPDDDLGPQIGPYPVLYFPLAATYDVVALSHRRLRTKDIDGDGRDEPVGVSARVRFVGFEDVDLPVARFERCAHIRTRTPITITASRSGRLFHALGTDDAWLAPNVGTIRFTSELVGFGKRESTDETLTGFLSPTGGVGFVDGLTIGSVSMLYDPNLAPPAVASDGTAALIASVRPSVDGDPHGLIGLAVSSTGTALREFQIADVPGVFGNDPTPAIAYGAGEFVVAYRRNGEPLHLHAVTADGARPWGAAALDLPFTTSPRGAFRAAFDGTNFLVLVQGAEIPAGDATVALARVSAAGALLGTTSLSDTISVYGGVAVAWDGASALCVWSIETELRAVRVAADGQVLDAAPIRLATAAGAKPHPAVAASPSGGWLVAWGDSGAARVKTCLVSADGVAATPDGVALGAIASDDGRPEIALDGAEFLVVSQETSPVGVSAARVSLDGLVVPQAAGGFGPPLAVSSVIPAPMDPIVARFVDRALVFWRTFESGAYSTTTLSGAVVFPRREELRRAAKSSR